MICLPIISISLCLLYVFFIVCKYGVPTSISETYYILPPKLDWMFSAWCTVTSIPFGIWWFTISPKNLSWIPIVVMICMCLIGASCRYKSGPKNNTEYKPNLTHKKTNKKFVELLNELKIKFNPKEFFKYGWAKPIHYIASLIVIFLISIYVNIINPLALPSMILSYLVFIIIGMNVEAIYNEDYSLDVDNSAWIFFMEIVCFLQLFIFVWSKI